jgi:hypothetical protein
MGLFAARFCPGGFLPAGVSGCVNIPDLSLSIPESSPRE